MNYVDYEALKYIVIVCSVIVCVVLFLLNFISILKFKWFIDYYKTIDSHCSAKAMPKLEVETIRYNLSNFFEHHYSNIQKDYTNSFYTFASFYTVLLMIFIALHIFYKISLSYFIYISIATVYIVYTIVNSIISANFANINNKIYNESNVVIKYKNVYKILNAIILIGSIYDDTHEFSDNKLNTSEKTFKQILDNNISSVENEYNTNRINRIRQETEGNLDFLKYFVLDKLSPFYLKYFDNTYVNITDQDNENISGTVYVNELYNKKTDIDFVFVRSNINQISNLINSQPIYKPIEEIVNEYPSIDNVDPGKQYDALQKFIKQIKNEMEFQKGTYEKHNKKAYDSITTAISNIETATKPVLYSSLIENLNDKIHNMFYKNNIDIKVPNDEYIQYFVENRHVLLNSSDEFKDQYGDILNTVTYQSEFAYAYIVFWAIIFLIVLHYLYITTNNYVYSISLVSTIVLLLSGIYLRQII